MQGMDSYSPTISPEYKDVDIATLARLPKVVLHDHIDGGLRPRTVIELAQASAVDLPATTEDDLRAWFTTQANGSLEDYLTVFDLTVAVMNTPDAIRRVVREALEDLAAENVVYAELRAAPQLFTGHGMSLREALDALVAELGSVPGITAGLLVCGMRQTDPAEVRQVAELTAEYYLAEKGVVGFDLAGPEAGFPAARHWESMEYLRKRLVPITLHAGEAAGVDSIEDALVHGALRLGHGMNIIDDLTLAEDGLDLQLGPVARWVRDRGIALEMCPSSNVQTKAVESLADHPLPLLFSMGFRCTVNTDNRLVSDTSMTAEFMKVVEEFNMGLEEIFQLTVAALEASFAPEPVRQRILTEQILPAYEELEYPEENADDEGPQGDGEHHHPGDGSGHWDA